MGKTNEIILLASENEFESDNDSLELVKPVLNLSLEHIENKDSLKQLNNQTKKFSKVQQKQKTICKKKKIPEHRRLSSLQKSNKNSTEKDDYSMKFLKTLPYIEFSANKKNESNQMENLRTLYLQINSSIKQIFTVKNICIQN
ncbi:unnamed protein product [Adineta ricciae]|uniref:Uncharacterized protein n=1 Tax=Adineta ricciae TaxID=249248 RepID=A0A815U7M6_ADIRI|nr:unnamed protein product [Adineta ricciae]